MKNLDIIFELLSYEGAATNDPADSERVKNRIQETEITAISRQQIQIPDATSDLDITLPDADSDYLIMLIDRDVSIKLNNASQAISLKTRANGKKTLAFFTRGSITGLSISNDSGATASVDIIICNK